MTKFLEIYGISKRFGGLRALDGSTANTAQGGIIGLSGPKGHTCFPT